MALHHPGRKISTGPVNQILVINKKSALTTDIAIPSEKNEECKEGI